MPDVSPDGIATPARRPSKPYIGAIVAACAVLLLVLAAPSLLDRYATSILVRSLLYGCIAVTVDILWGYAGILSFGQAAFFGIGAYACGLAFDTWALAPLVAVGALVAGPAIAAAAALFVAWLGFGPRATPLYITLLTLVQSVIFVQLIYSGGDVTGSSSGISGFETFDIGMDGWFRIAGAGLVGTTLLGWILVRSDFGRLLIAIRENEQRCRYCGIGTAWVKAALFAGSAIVAALCGYAYAAYNDVVAPDLGNFQFGTELVIWVALGGRGTLLGPAIAAVAIDFVSAYLSGMLPFIWQLFVGLLFIAVIVLLPQGLGPALGSLLRRVLPRWRGTPLVARCVPAPEADRGGSARAIALDGVSCRYGSLQVLDNIGFQAGRGELVSLVGPNGAGKTTVIRCISDGLERSGGQVAIEGKGIGRKPPEHCVRLGVGRKFQAPNVFDALTVADSLRIARARHERLSVWRRAETIALPAAAWQVVLATGLSAQLGTTVRHLSHGSKQALELAMVLAMEPRVLLLDEPTAGLTKAERSLIGGVLTGLARDHGICILLIEHDLEFVREISSRIIVLHQGRLALDGGVAEVADSELVRTIYSGAAQV